MADSRLPLLALALLAVSAPTLAQPGEARGSTLANYTFAADVELGGPGFWDYLTFDAATKRIYAAHYDRVTVFDSADYKLLGTVGPIKGAHGIAIVSSLNKGYVASGEDGSLKVFSLTDFKVVKEIKVTDDVDGALFDPHTGMVLVVAGDTKMLAVIDPRTDTVRLVPLLGKPEFLAVDDTGNVYINLAEENAVVKIAVASGEVLANWPLAGCVAPHGIAYDGRSHRLFSGCSNGRLVVIDAANGRNLASLPIGPRSDGVAVDSARGLAFTASALGTLSVISIGAGDQYSVVRTIPTFFGGRNLTIDPTTGDLFVAHGDMKLLTPTTDVLALKFGWDGLSVAQFNPQR